MRELVFFVLQRIHLIRLAGGEPDEVDKPSHGYAY